jgi:hypothetical protein
MAEPSVTEYVALTSGIIASLVLALLAAGLLKRSEIGAIFQGAAEASEIGPARNHLLAFVEKLERAGSEAELVCLLLAGWLPKEIADAVNRNALH